MTTIEHDPICCGIYHHTSCPACRAAWEETRPQTMADWMADQEREADAMLFSKVVESLADELRVRPRDLAGMLDRRAKRLAEDAIVAAVPTILALAKGGPR